MQLGGFEQSLLGEITWGALKWLTRECTAYFKIRGVLATTV
jgi:hypothetical protein